MEIGALLGAGGGRTRVAEESVEAEGLFISGGPKSPWALYLTRVQFSSLNCNTDKPVWMRNLGVWMAVLADVAST
jgi:hypothetical protein